jgi:hypothetical protein
MKDALHLNGRSGHQKLCTSAVDFLFQNLQRLRRPFNPQFQTALWLKAFLAGLSSNPQKFPEMLFESSLFRFEYSVR